MISIVWMTALLLPFFKSDEVTWKARILDADTGKPIGAVHVLSNRRQAISDMEGNFELKIENGEKVVFSHVAYQKLELQENLQQLPDTVYLILLETPLEEVEIRSFPTEEDFKNEVLTTPYFPTVLEQNLQNNLDYAKSIYKLGYFYDLSSYNVLLERIRPNGGATFFTSSGGGILQAIRDLKKPSVPPFPNRPAAGSQSLGVKRLFIPDSLRKIKDYF